MVAAQAAAQNTTKAKLWKRLKQMKQSQNTARKVKQTLGNGAIHTGLSQVMAPASKEDPRRVTFTTKEESKNACLEEAEQHFMQAAQTPIQQPPMIDLLGTADMDSPAFKQILTGTFECPMKHDPYIRKL